METFSALPALCTGNSPVTGEFPAQRPVARSFAVFCGLRLNKRLSKQSWGWWFETPPRSLLRHWNERWLGCLTVQQIFEFISDQNVKFRPQASYPLRLHLCHCSIPLMVRRHYLSPWTARKNQWSSAVSNLLNVIYLCSIPKLKACHGQKWFTSNHIELYDNPPCNIYLDNHIYWNQHIEARGKWPSCSRRQFEVYCVERGFVYFVSYFQLIPWGLLNNESSLTRVRAYGRTGSRPLFELNDDDSNHWRHMASLGPDDFIHLPLDTMVAVFQTIFSNGGSWMKIYEFRLKCHWSLFLWFQ